MTSAPSEARTTTEEADALLTELMEALGQIADGEFGTRLRRREGKLGEVADRYNEVARQLENRSVAIHKIVQVVGREGRMTERISEEPLRGTWLSNARAINGLIDDLTRPAIEIARVIAAVAEGDLTQHLDLDIEDRRLRGEFRTIGRTVNKMVDQLSSFADERVAVAARGEVADLKDNINQMIVTLRETTKKNSEQSWLDSNLARIGGVLQASATSPRSPG